MRVAAYLVGALLSANVTMALLVFIISGPPTPLRVIAMLNALLLGGMLSGWLLNRGLDARSDPTHGRRE